jgi:hypothetical protein
VGVQLLAQRRAGGRTQSGESEDGDETSSAAGVQHGFPTSSRLG